MASPPESIPFTKSIPFTESIPTAQSVPVAQPDRSIQSDRDIVPDLRTQPERRTQTERRTGLDRASQPNRRTHAARHTDSDPAARPGPATDHDPVLAFDHLRLLFQEVISARDALTIARRAPLGRSRLVDAPRARLLLALEAYTAELTSRNLPVPYGIRDDLRIQRRILGRAAGGSG